MPVERPLVITGHSIASLVHDGQLRLCRLVACCASLCQPPYRSGGILHARAKQIQTKNTVRESIYVNQRTIESE
jgi:hypothetical protein